MGFARRLSAIILAAGIMAGCNQSNNIYHPPQPIINPDCIIGSAADYANKIGLPLDVSIYDDNTNKNQKETQCFTIHEKKMIDQLSVLLVEGAKQETLQQIVVDYPTVGPATIWALEQTWNATLKDQQYDTDMQFYDTGVLGWIALDIATGVSLPGKILEDWGLEDNTPYPIDHNLKVMFPPDWNPNPGVASTFLEYIPGCEDIMLGGQPYPDYLWQSSADVIYSHESRSNPRPIRSALPPGAQIIRIHVVELEHMLGGTFNEGIVALRYDVHPDDRHLIGFDSVFEYMAHTVPNESNLSPERENWFFTVDDYNFNVGDKVGFGEIVAYQNPRYDFTGPIYDHTIFVGKKYHELIGIGSPFDERLHVQTIDYMASHYSYNELGVPRAFNAFPTEPRYENMSVHGCSIIK